MLTHVQIDEILNTPGDNPRRDRLVSMLAEIPARRIPTYGFIVGLSRLGNARVTDDDGADFIEALQAGNPKRNKDAVLIATARFEDATFLSCDRQAVNTARRHGVPALRPPELVELLRADPSSSSA